MAWVVVPEVHVTAPVSGWVVPSLNSSIAEKSVVVPKPIPEAKPLLLTVATEVLEEVQVAVLVRSFVDPLLNKPVAAYCSEPQVAVTV